MRHLILGLVLLSPVGELRLDPLPTSTARMDGIPLYGTAVGLWPADIAVTACGSIPTSTRSVLLF